MDMLNIKINGIPYSVPKGITILEACQQVGIKIPTLCFLKDLNEIGACRICVVEVKGARSLVADSNTAATKHAFAVVADHMRRAIVDFAFRHNTVIFSFILHTEVVAELLQFTRAASVTGQTTSVMGGKQ
jgi:predicted molibdopterin-dependent oxidoreductase YjgC